MMSLFVRSHCIKRGLIWVWALSKIFVGIGVSSSMKSSNLEELSVDMFGGSSDTMIEKC